jgi:membrane protein DedA with SNARE-associated domain
MRNFLIALIAGILIWGAILLIAIAYQPSHAGSVVASIEIGLALVLAVVVCLLLRLR